MKIHHNEEINPYLHIKFCQQTLVILEQLKDIWIWGVIHVKYNLSYNLYLLNIIESWLN
jgi:hypothetical protein